MVVRAVAEAHQGRFILRSKPGRGTSALVELPLLSDFSVTATESDAVTAENRAQVFAGGYR